MGNAKVKTLMLGGKVILKNGKPTGVLIDNAIKLVSDKIPETGTKESRSVLIPAQENCFSVGLTTVADAGLVWIKKIETMSAIHKDNSLKLKIYAVVNPSRENEEYYYKNGTYQGDQLTVRSFKIYGDGALGSRAAALLLPYHGSD